MEKQLELISKKLSILIALIVKSENAGLASAEAIRLLDGYGIPNNEIATILDMKPNAVSMARARNKEK